jgi:hypothetical protein
MAEIAAKLVWETDLPLFSPMMQAQWGGGVLATIAVMILIMAPIFISQGEWDAMLGITAMAAATGAGLWLLGLLIMALMFRGRYRVRFTLDSKGILCETIDKVAKTANRLALVAGVLARKPGVAGSGLIAMSQESVAIRWAGAFRAVYRPKRHIVLLRNNWRTLMWVQCTPENYAAVAEAIAQHMTRRRTTSRTGGRSPLPKYLGRSLLVLLACMPLFPLSEEFHTSLFLPILVMCFALAMVWLVPLFGYVVIGGLGIQVFLVIMDMLAVRESSLFPGEKYRGYEVISDTDISLLVLSGIGAALLVRLSWRFLKGRVFSALAADHADMDGG